jgi:hypothetical protein
MALLISVGNLGGIAGSNVYLAQQAPKYQVGFGVCLAISIAAVLMAIVLRFAYAAENQKRKRMLSEQGDDAIRNEYGEQTLLDIGDRNPFFIYTL